MHVEGDPVAGDDGAHRAAVLLSSGIGRHGCFWLSLLLVVPGSGGDFRTLVVVVISGACSIGESYPSAAATNAAGGATGAAATAGAGVTPEGGKLASGEGGGCCWGCGVESGSAAVVDEVVCGHEAEGERGRSQL